MGSVGRGSRVLLVALLVAVYDHSAHRSPLRCSSYGRIRHVGIDQTGILTIPCLLLALMTGYRSIVSAFVSAFVSASRTLLRHVARATTATETLSVMQPNFRAARRQRRAHPIGTRYAAVLRPAAFWLSIHPILGWPG